MHGFAGTPPEVRELAERLADNGYDVLAPLFEGHGETPEAMARTRWQDWARSAEDALRTLQHDCREVFVAGQSLGGSMALHLAANHPEVKGVIAMAAMGSPRFFRDWRLRLLWGLKYVVRWHMPGDDSDLGDPNALLSLHSYARRPTACIQSMLEFLRVLEGELSKVRMPALILQGRNDRTAPTDNAPFIFERLASTDKQLRWLERSGHAITVDLEKGVVNETILNWLAAH